MAVRCEIMKFEINDNNNNKFIDMSEVNVYKN